MHTRTFSSDLEFKVSRNDEYERIFELEWLGGDRSFPQSPATHIAWHIMQVQ